MPYGINLTLLCLPCHPPATYLQALNNDLVTPFWELANDSIHFSYITLNTGWLVGRSGWEMYLLTSHKLPSHMHGRLSLFNEKAGFRGHFLTTEICIFLHIFSQHYFAEAVIHSSSVCLMILIAYKDFSQTFLLDFLLPNQNVLVFSSFFFQQSGLYCFWWEVSCTTMGQGIFLLLISTISCWLPTFWWFWVWIYPT